MLNLREKIYNKQGDVIKQSRNLRGIREYVSYTIITELYVYSSFNRVGRLDIQFADGSYYSTTFNDYEVLKDFVRKWRNVYGAPLYTIRYTSNNLPYKKYIGVVSYHNDFLQPNY